MSYEVESGYVAPLPERGGYPWESLASDNTLSFFVPGDEDVKRKVRMSGRTYSRSRELGMTVRVREEEKDGVDGYRFWLVEKV